MPKKEGAVEAFIIAAGQTVRKLDVNIFFAVNRALLATPLHRTQIPSSKFLIPNFFHIPLIKPRQQISQIRDRKSVV
jgi:hypothetical protein